MGLLLGLALRRKVDAGALPWPLLRPVSASAPRRSELRSTASSSAETRTYISNPGALLPRKNLQVLQAVYVAKSTSIPEKLGTQIAEHFRLRSHEGDSEAGARIALGRNSSL